LVRRVCDAFCGVFAARLRARFARRLASGTLALLSKLASGTLALLSKLASGTLALRPNPASGTLALLSKLASGTLALRPNPASGTLALLSDPASGTLALRLGLLRQGLRVSFLVGSCCFLIFQSALKR
jgi:hypothetical protein